MDEAAPAPAPPCVMLLSVWGGRAGPWHARIVLPDARALDFSSPFELARYLGQVQDEGAAGRSGGLR